MSDHRAFLEAVLEQLQRPPVETMGFEELRAEVLALRDNMRLLYGVWQEAEDDVEGAAREGAAWMQGACVEWLEEWIASGEARTGHALVAGIQGLPLPGDGLEEGDDDGE